jgi:putative DNA primase/helicase
VHLAELRSSGLSDETIRVCGFYSEDNPLKLAGILQRRYPKSRGAALVIPFRSPSGELNGYRRVKPSNPRKDRNGRPVKYESPSGVGNRAFIPPNTVSVLNDPKVELLFTEGEKKAAKADQENFPCVGLVGVFGWKVGKGADRLISDLEAIEWKGRPVCICFDSDLNDKPEVRDAESRLAVQLENRGARVRVARLPDGPNGEKVGLDDFLCAHDGMELRKLLDRAEDPDPVVDDVKATAAEIDAMPEARRFITEVCTRDEELILRCWQGEFYGHDGTRYRVIPEDEMRERVVTYLDKSFSRLNITAVSNVLACIAAQTLVSSRKPMPSWIGMESPWDAAECLVCANGILPVRSLDTKPTLIAPTPALFTVNGLDFAFDPKAACPRWLEFLAQLWPADPQSIEVLQEIIGYLLLPETRYQKMFMLIGPRRSGKGTIARVAKQVVGPDNVCSPRLGSLAGDFGLQPLLRKTVAIIGDARLSRRIDSAAIV